MFSDHITPKEFKNATVTGHSRFVLEKQSGKSHEYRDVVVFKKLRLKSQCVQTPSASKQERLQKAPFS